MSPQSRAPRGALLLLAVVSTLPVACSQPPVSTHPTPDNTGPALSYPETKRVPVTEEHFGQTIVDHYRWLEGDAQSDEQVVPWVEAQNQTTATYLSALPGRDAFRKSLASLFDFERVSSPYKRGNRYFYLRKSGLQNQPLLYVREGVNGQDRPLIDPNRWSSDGAHALAEWAVSEDGSRVAYAVQENGSDRRTIKVLDVDTGNPLDDEVQWARFTGIEWMKDGSGFFYARYAQGDGAPSGLTHHTVYFHRLGTPQSRDRVLFATPDHPHRFNSVQVTDDGHYAVISSSANLATNSVSVVDLSSAEWTPRTLIEDAGHSWGFVASVGPTFFLVTDKDAARSKLVTVDVAAVRPVFKDFVPEQDAILTEVTLLGGRVFVSFLVDAKTEVRRYRLDGTPDGVMPLPGIGSVQDLRGDPEDPEGFFVFTSFNTPYTVYRYDAATGTAAVWIEPGMRADLQKIRVDQVFYTSKDGTRIPMFLIRKPEVVTPAPTLLYGYGGYSISLTPAYSAVLLAWVEQGGVLAIPNIRGGAEYGSAWHEAGRLGNKQNVFDDFIAAAEYLLTSKTASAGGIAIHGESNGGLLVGAVVNQRPELFAAALPSVGVMDMLRFNLFTGGPLWMGEFGDPAREADFRNLVAYSPYHNIQPGKPYPAILAATADTDDRVVPAHTFKYVAALQAADPGGKPHLVRVETRAGHGTGKPTDKIIGEAADLLAFAAHWTGLELKD